MGQCLGVAAEVAQQVLDDENKHQQQQDTTPSPANSSSNAAVHAFLPDGAEQYTVRNVYDGDTLTLTNEKRVRFLGIDTPEIKQKQPFAQEAKAYTKNLCDNKQIWLSYEGNKQDHYGRLLAWVWVQQGDGSYLCVNEGIVGAGFARVYIPNANSKPNNWTTLLSLQKEARLAKKGVWSQFNSRTVYKTRHGAAYHLKDCKHIRDSHLESINEADAIDQGLHPCRTCLP